MKVQKYIKTEHYQFVFFPESIRHDHVSILDWFGEENVKIVSAGFCLFDDGKVTCYGKSFSLELKSLPEDSEEATMQFYGK